VHLWDINIVLMLNRWSHPKKESLQVQEGPLTQRKIQSFKQDPIVLSFYHFVSKHNLRGLAWRKLKALKELKKTKLSYEDLVQ